ncbi:hypothetical protein Tco_0269368 [Tanacetum coccineum]
MYLKPMRLGKQQLSVYHDLHWVKMIENGARTVKFSSNQIELHFPNPEKSLQFRQVEESESDNLFHDCIQGEDENAEDVQMADHLRLMEELLRILILGIEDAIVVPAVLADQFELKPELLDFISNNPFFGLENDDSYSLHQGDSAGGNLMTRNTQDTLTIIENKARVRSCRNTPQVSSSGGTSTQIDAIIALTKQVEALEYHFASMRETYDQNQEAAVQLMQHQMDQMADFQERPLALENPTGRVDHFVYRIDIVDSLCDNLPIENNSLSGSPTLSPDPVVESLSPSLTPSGEIDLLLEVTGAFLSLDDSIPSGINNGIYDLEGDILFLEELLNDQILRDLPPKELKDDEPSTTKSLIEKPLDIDNEIYNSEGDTLFFEKLLKGEP